MNLCRHFIKPIIAITILTLLGCGSQVQTGNSLQIEGLATIDIPGVDNGDLIGGGNVDGAGNVDEVVTPPSSQSAQFKDVGLIVQDVENDLVTAVGTIKGASTPTGLRVTAYNQNIDHDAERDGTIEVCNDNPELLCFRIKDIDAVENEVNIIVLSLYQLINSSEELMHRVEIELPWKLEIPIHFD